MKDEQLFEVADLILAVARHINAAKEANAESGTPLEGAVMRFVDRHPGTTVNAAAEATQMISSNVSRAVRGLENKGLLRREADPEDARRVRLYPTPKAAENLQKLRDTWSALLDGTFTGPAEIDALIKTLHGIEARLVAQSRDAR
ncbi:MULTISPECIES: MarR family winged helix-turn-helix transcriptional regulator [Amycolatopsis]|uniref:MarR family transcriptional regulator n=1 Tax=Amycolatopsis dendrobii TaxID=2760662 RepID=A0A7W3W7J7_9PSEU|nr:MULTISPECIES: MarR family transcriptional regulator [Amycolatopsis]MBB1159787.1 MarR family transcriptional regulator [Amycolatopsis dendrobii]UKD52558.1 MarR family transcriptional regulator [Amycolatopsis sp. FU40]